MNKPLAKYLIKEFNETHERYSVSNLGHWKSDWKEQLKYMDVIHDQWYWKGHRLMDLQKFLKTGIYEKYAEKSD